jgi:plasmid stabilization system protein ParE
MRDYSLAKLAELDLLAIARRLQKTQGSAQCKQYIEGLRDCFRFAAEDPTLGRRSEEVLPGLRWIGYNMHAFFYAIEAERVFIARVLPQDAFPTAPRS